MPFWQHQQALTDIESAVIVRLPEWPDGSLQRCKHKPPLWQCRLCKLKHFSAARTCRIDSNTSPKQNDSSLFCGEEYILFEISLVAVATTKKIFKNRLVVCLCCVSLETLHLIQYYIFRRVYNIAKSDFYICHVTVYVRQFILLIVRTEIIDFNSTDFH